MAGLLSPAAGEELAFRYVRRLVASVHDDDFAVVLHNCGRAARQVPAMAATGASALHLGNAVRMADVAAQATSGTLPFATSHHAPRWRTWTRSSRHSRRGNARNQEPLPGLP